jgi:hypothetical protein
MRLAFLTLLATTLAGIFGQPSAFSTPVLTETPTPLFTAASTTTATQTATSTPLFVVTAYPTTTATSTLTATPTPLYMITAWPTPTSAFNSTPTSTPLFYLTPYPSYDPTNGTTVLPSYITDLLNKAPSGTATILGGVAVGLVGVAAVAYAVRYLRNGGTVKGLFQKAMANRGKLAQLSKAVPMNAEMRKALEMANQGADKAAAIAEKPTLLLDQLPVGDSIKENLKKVVPKGNVYDMMEAAQNPAELQAKVLAQMKSMAPDGAGALVNHLPVDEETKRKIQALTQKQLAALVHTEVAAPAVNVTVVEPAVSQSLASAVASVAKPAEVILQVNAEDLAEVQAALAAKRAAEQTTVQKGE